jgi:hypothetical protein
MSEHMDDNGEFVATPEQWQAFVESLDRRARVIPELIRLFSERQKQEFVTENTEGAE